MKGKITLLTGAAVGYVLGTRAGRERYDAMKRQAESLWRNPKVQEKAQAAQDFAKEKAPEMQQKVTGVVQDKMGHGSSADHSTDFSTVSSPGGHLG